VRKVIVQSAASAAAVAVTRRAAAVATAAVETVAVAVMAAVETAAAAVVDTAEIIDHPQIALIKRPFVMKGLFISMRFIEKKREALTASLFNSILSS
jgi:hypothetical protein